MRPSRPRTVGALQVEIAQKRGDLAEHLDLLRDAISVRLDPLAQLRAHPRIALALAGITVGIAAFLAVAFVRGVRASR
jgi:hypothetical protein